MKPLIIKYKGMWVVTYPKNINVSIAWRVQDTVAWKNARLWCQHANLRPENRQATKDALAASPWLVSCELIPDFGIGKQSAFYAYSIGIPLKLNPPMWRTPISKAKQ